MAVPAVMTAVVMFDMGFEISCRVLLTCGGGRILGGFVPWYSV
jgi:hypothetical protein